MRRHPMLWLLAGTYLLLVGVWPAAAAPVNLAATGAFTVLAQPAVLLAALLVGALMAIRRQPTPAQSHTRRH